MAFLLRNSVASHLQSHSQRAQNDSLSQSRRQFHVEPGPREKALLAADPSLKRFKSHKKGVSRVKRLGDVLTIVVIAGTVWYVRRDGTEWDEAFRPTFGAPNGWNALFHGTNFG